MAALADLISDAEALLALEPDELGVLIIKAATAWPPTDSLMLDSFLRLYVGQPQIPGQGSAPAVPYPRHRQGEIGEAIREAWAWLEGQGLLLPSPHHAATTTIRVLSRRARRISQQSDPRKVLTHRTIPKATQHPAIREDVWASYTRGKFGTAVFEAMVAVEVAVREASGIMGLGVPLMRDAFKPQGGPLADMNSDMGEREARSARSLPERSAHSRTPTRIERLIWTIRTRLPKSLCWLISCYGSLTAGDQANYESVCPSPRIVVAGDQARPCSPNRSPGTSINHIRGGPMAAPSAPF